MDYIDLIYEKKDIIGKIFVLISLAILFYMFINPINSVIIQYDERFTINLLLLPWNDMWGTILADVHPPLYYLILKGISSIFISNGVDTIFVYKIVSIIPYILLLIVSVTKIRNDYGWFTCGIFMFTIATMSEFFIKFLTIRMYSWGLLFLVLAFIYLKDVIDKSDSKSWALFTLFVVLAMYIHNIILIPLGILYVLLLVYLYAFKDNFKEELKKWLISAIITVLCYLPWLFVLINQINSPHGNGLQSFDMLFCFLCFSSYENNITLYLLTVALLVVSCLILYSNFKGKFIELKNGDSAIPYVLIGLITFFGTVIVGAVILPIMFAPITARYLVPLSGIIWFSISVLLGTYEKNKILWLVAVVLIVLLGCANFATEINASSTLYDTSITEKQLLEELNTDDNIIIYGSRFIYLTHNYDLNNTDAYALKNLKAAYDADYKVQKNITKILEENPDKDVYIIKTVKNKKDSTFGKNIKSKKVGTSRGDWIIKLELDN